MYCTYCGSMKHTRMNCPKTYDGSVKHSQMRCDFCGEKDHTIEACPFTYNGNAARKFYPESVSNYYVRDK